MKGMVGHVTRVARADEALASKMADTMEMLSADLRLDRMVADAARVLKSGEPLAVRIVRPSGRVTYR
jgi:hypothetical protein